MARHPQCGVAEGSRGLRPLGRPVLVALATVALAACASSPTPREAFDATIRVENRADRPVTVYLNGARLGTADPGGIRCLRIHHLPSDRVYPLEFRFAGDRRRYLAPRDRLQHAPGWSVWIGRNPVVDLVSLQPSATC